MALVVRGRSDEGVKWETENDYLLMQFYSIYCGTILLSVLPFFSLPLLNNVFFIDK